MNENSIMTDELIRPHPSEDALANGLFGSSKDRTVETRICEMDASRFALLYADPGLHLCPDQIAHDGECLFTV
jgi:hypothetical protein